MFERFTTEARQTVVGAQTEARQLAHCWIGTEHLLLALLARQTPSTAVLAGHGVTHDAVAASIAAYRGDDLDANALSTLGIDLDAVRDSVETTFGPGALDAPARQASCRRTGGHIPFSPRAKRVLELSLREAIALKSRSITDGHLLLGLIRESEGMAAQVLHDRGVDLPALRDEIRLALNS